MRLQDIYSPDHTKDSTMNAYDVIATAASTIACETVLNGGATVDIESGTTVSRHGYVVALGAEYTWKMHTTNQDVRTRFNSRGGLLDWVTQYVEHAVTWIDEFPVFAPVYVGSWIDEGTDTLYLDLVEIVSDKATALKLARRRGELAIFDNTNGVDIPVVTLRKSTDN